MSFYSKLSITASYRTWAVLLPLLASSLHSREGRAPAEIKLRADLPVTVYFQLFHTQRLKLRRSGGRCIVERIKP